ncbi:hypothetical protein ABZU32_35145 [Sphaerisporangium sp. NPDC005288]|uniref:hypothetical protein n=1 Tax=Sphaerisporangium sp. NPDC005288 TaxID=3155114 RepID=UPI0033BD08E9
MSEAAAGRRFGEGPLSRISALVYTLLVVELSFLAAALPGLAGLVLLDRSAGNLPLAVACALPVGPALSAALYALHRRGRDLADLRPAAAFWRGYRANLGGVLKLWIPYLVWMAIVATTLANLGAAGVPGWWAALLAAVAVAATLWAAGALVVTSLFAFRAADVARLAAYFLSRRPAVTLANACLLVVAGGVTLVATEAVTALLASVLAAALLWNTRTVVAEVEREFTAPAAGPPTGEI